MDKIRKFIRWLLVVVVLTTLLSIVISVVGEFFIELAREKRFYDNPTQKLDAAMTALRGFMTSDLVLWATFLVLGLTIGLWFDALLRRIEGRWNRRMLIAVIILGVSTLVFVGSAMWILREVKGKAQGGGDPVATHSSETQPTEQPQIGHLEKPPRIGRFLIHCPGDLRGGGLCGDRRGSGTLTSVMRG